MQIAGMTGENKMVRPATRPHHLHLKVAFLSKQVSLTQLLQLTIREIDVFVNVSSALFGVNKLIASMAY
mgnify:CR=1 FL=1